MSAVQCVPLKSTIVFDLSTDGSGRAFVALNFNGSPYQISDKNICGWGNTTSLNEVAFPHTDATTGLSLNYGQVRCCALKVEYQPYFINDAAAQFAYVPMESFYDVDGSSFTPFSAWPTYETIVQCPKRRTHNLSRPFKRYFKAKKQGLIPKYQVAETNQPNQSQNPAGLWHYSKSNIGSFSFANSVHAGFYMSGGSATKVVGKFIVTAYLLFKDINTV